MSTVAEETYKRMHEYDFWVAKEVTLYNLCKETAQKLCIELTPAQTRIAAKELERKFL
jgi:hypothetical protein